jgi:effector-binding domain-containing protein
VTNVTVQNVQARPLAAVRGQYARETLSSVLIASLDQVYAFLNERKMGGRGHNIVIYSSHQDMVAGVEISGPFEPAGNVVAAATPAGRVATATHVGPYKEMGRTNDAITAWCRESGLQLAGPSWEVYGDWEEDQSKLVTDVFSLLRDPASSAVPTHT